MVTCNRLKVLDALDNACMSLLGLENALQCVGISAELENGPSKITLSETLYFLSRQAEHIRKGLVRDLEETEE